MRNRLIRLTLPAVLLAVASCVESPTCHSAELDFWWQHEAFQGVDLDTGWIPASSPVQLRS